MEEIKNEIAKQKGYPDWKTMENWIIDNNPSVNVALLLVSAMEEVCNRIVSDRYSIVITDVAKFRVELMTMIEQVKYQIGDYSKGSSSEVAERFEHTINSLI
jgi:hypothetical protein